MRTESSVVVNSLMMMIACIIISKLTTTLDKVTHVMEEKHELVFKLLTLLVRDCGLRRCPLLHLFHDAQEFAII